MCSKTRNKFIVEAWVSPNRKEVYDSSTIYCGAPSLALDELYSDFLCDADDGIFTLFDEQDTGLWNVKVTMEAVSYRFWSDWGYEYDTDFEVVEVWNKGKCGNFSELRYTWAHLKGGLLNAEAKNS